MVDDGFGGSCSARAVVCLQQQVSLLAKAGRSRTNESTHTHTQEALKMTTALHITVPMLSALIVASLITLPNCVGREHAQIRKEEEY